MQQAALATKGPTDARSSVATKRKLHLTNVTHGATVRRHGLHSMSRRAASQNQDTEGRPRIERDELPEDRRPQLGNVVAPRRRRTVPLTTQQVAPPRSSKRESPTSVGKRKRHSEPTCIVLDESDDEGGLKADGEPQGTQTHTPIELRHVRRSTRTGRKAYHALSFSAKHGIQRDDTVLYPKGASDAVELQATDFDCLNVGEYLNDTVIDFYLRYLVEEVFSSDQRQRFHLFNSFFHKKLTEKMRSKEDKEASTREMLSWTKNTDIFSKQAVFVPIHHRSHWSLAVILNPGCLESATSDTRQLILHLDSLANGHSSAPIGQSLRQFMKAAWEAKHSGASTETELPKDTEEIQRRSGTDVPSPWSKARFPCIRAQVPVQPNLYDCGVYLLHFVELLCRSLPPHIKFDDCTCLNQRTPARALRGVEDNVLFGKKWFKSSGPASKRSTIRDHLCDLFLEQAPTDDRRARMLEMQQEYSYVSACEIGLSNMYKRAKSAPPKQRKVKSGIEEEAAEQGVLAGSQFLESSQTEEAPVAPTSLEVARDTKEEEQKQGSQAEARLDVRKDLCRTDKEFRCGSLDDHRFSFQSEDDIDVRLSDQKKEQAKQKTVQLDPPCIELEQDEVSDRSTIVAQSPGVRKVPRSERPGKEDKSMVNEGSETELASKVGTLVADLDTSARQSTAPRAAAGCEDITHILSEAVQ